MNIIITMAGMGSRFREAGYTVPKFMIEVGGKTLFEWSMMSLVDYNKQPNVRYIFIVRKEDDARSFIEEKMKGFGVGDIEVVEIDALTDGQATSAMLAKPYWREEEEMVIYNIDTYVEPGALRYEDVIGDGYIPCFHAPGEHWSFVKLDSDGRVTEIREKERVSDNCTIGLYYFRTCSLYEKIYNEYYADAGKMEKGEKFIAPLYNYMVEHAMEVRISIVPFEKVHVLGTPKEVEAFKKRECNIVAGALG